MRRIRWDPLPQRQSFQNFLHARNEPWIETDSNLKGQDQGCMMGVVVDRFLTITEFLSWFVQYGLSHCPAARELYFCWLMLGISVTKFQELVPVVVNRLHTYLEQTPSESHLQNSTRHTTLRWSRTYFCNDDFGRLTGTEPLFRVVRVAVIDQFFITCDNSPDKCIIYEFTDKLTTDIHSTLSLLRCQFVR